jgi:hypothetical protein
MSEPESKEARYLRIVFNDGSERRFAYTAMDADRATSSGRIERFLESKHLILDFEDKVCLFPFTSIKSIEIAPNPEVKLPNSLNVLYEFD